MKAIKITLLLVVFSAFVISCESNTYEQISGVVTNPTYQAKVKGIMANNCTSCHNPTYDQSPYLESYAGQAWPADNILCIASLSKHDKVLPPQYKSTISTWVTRIKGKLDAKTGMIPHFAGIHHFYLATRFSE